MISYYHASSILVNVGANDVLDLFRSIVRHIDGVLLAYDLIVESLYGCSLEDFLTKLVSCGVFYV